MDRIPKQIEQYQTENTKLEKDLPTLREIVGCTWKKEEELKALKSEAATLERKIQLTLAPLAAPPTSMEGTEQKQEMVSSMTENKSPIVIIPSKPSIFETYKGFKI